LRQRVEGISQDDKNGNRTITGYATGAYAHFTPNLASRQSTGVIKPAPMSVHHAHW
jgi:hypothetical protein